MPSPADHDRSKHWLDYFDVLVGKSSLVVLTLLAFLWTRTSSLQNLSLLDTQVRNQIRAVELQDRSSQAQVASSILPYMKCQSPQWAMALRIVNSGAPNYAVDASNILAGCAKTTAERVEAAKLRADAETIELRSAFFKRLVNAREYRRVGLDSDAAAEYEQAYTALPSDYDKFVDHNAAEKGRRALQDSQFREAADSFESAFGKIAIP